jgi:hypothetical protein
MFSWKAFSKLLSARERRYQNARIPISAASSNSSRVIIAAQNDVLKVSMVLEIFHANRPEKPLPGPNSAYQAPDL